MKNIFYVLIVILFCSGCASIVSGPRQRVSFNSNPPGANIYINDSLYGVTPKGIHLKRKTKQRDIKLEFNGYETYQLKTARIVNGWVWGNLFFGGLIGLVIDALTGSMYKVYPFEINVDLKKTQ